MVALVLGILIMRESRRAQSSSELKLRAESSTLFQDRLSKKIKKILKKVLTKHRIDAII
jgi:hypothetical protein